MKKAEDSQLNYNEEAVTCVKNEMIPDEYVTKLASFFKSVSEENRVRMMQRFMFVVLVPSQNPVLHLLY